MASRLTNQFLYSFNPKLTFIEGSFRIGGSGIVAGTSATLTYPTATGSSAIVGRGVSSVVQKGTGVYQLQLTDNYYRLVDFQASVIAPTSAAGSIQDGSLSVGKPYQIIFPSTSTNWAALGVPSGVTPQLGVPFIASSGASNGPSGSSGATAAGNGTVIPIITSAVGQIELMGNPNLVLGPLPQQGAYVYFQTTNTSNALASPTSGTVIRFNLSLRDSSLLLTNETTSNY